MRAFSVRRSSSISTQPATPADAVSPAAPHRGAMPSHRGSGIANRVAEHRRQRDADDARSAAASACRAARSRSTSTGGRASTPAGRRPSRRECPRRRRASAWVKRPVCSSAPAMTSPSARNAIADGTTKNAICRSPASSRCRTRLGAVRIGARRARHRRQFRGRHRHPEQAHRQRVQQSARSTGRSTAPVGSRLASSVSMYALICTTPRLTKTGAKFRTTVRTSRGRGVEREAQVRRDAQHDRQLHARTAARCRRPIPTQAARRGAAATCAPPKTSERRDHRDVPHDAAPRTTAGTGGGC